MAAMQLIIIVLQFFSLAFKIMDKLIILLQAQKKSIDLQAGHIRAWDLKWKNPQNNTEYVVKKRVSLVTVNKLFFLIIA